jgi:hypothetical protein
MNLIFIFNSILCQDGKIEPEMLQAKLDVTVCEDHHLPLLKVYYKTDSVFVIFKDTQIVTKGYKRHSVVWQYASWPVAFFLSET